nr:DUF2279 domain-containing protein [Fodinibius salsisoli]
MITGIYTGLFIYEQNHRWNVPKVPFHFSSGLNAKGFDKFGHFYATKSQAELISNLYTFSNIRSGRSNLLGAGIALTVQSLIEIKDGKVSDVGFDVYDQISNLMGIAWFYGRENSAFLKRFNFRWFYHPSKDKQLLPKGSLTRFIEDYNGHSYWLTTQVGDFIPYWPRFIVPAAGITLNNWSYEQNQSGYYSYHLSFNLDFTHIIPQHSSWGKISADLLNSFYVPAPAIEVYPDFGFELLFSIDL